MVMRQREGERGAEDIFGVYLRSGRRAAGATRCGVVEVALPHVVVHVQVQPANPSPQNAVSIQIEQTSQAEEEEKIGDEIGVADLEEDLFIGRDRRRRSREGSSGVAARVWVEEEEKGGVVYG